MYRFIGIGITILIIILVLVFGVGDGQTQTTLVGFLIGSLIAQIASIGVGK